MLQRKTALQIFKGFYESEKINPYVCASLNISVFSPRYSKEAVSGWFFPKMGNCEVSGIGTSFFQGFFGQTCQLAGLKVDLPSKKPWHFNKKTQNTSPVLFYLHPSMAKVHTACTPSSTNSSVKKQPCPIILLAQMCRLFGVLGGHTAVKDSLCRCLQTCSTHGFAIMATILAQMSLCCIPVILPSARQVQNPVQGKAQLQWNRVGDRHWRHILENRAASNHVSPSGQLSSTNLALDGVSASRHEFLIHPGLFWKEILFTNWEESTENSHRSPWMDCEQSKAATPSRDSNCW